MLQRLCKEIAKVVLSDFDLSSTAMPEVALRIRERLGQTVSKGAASDIAVDWIVGNNKDGSVVGVAGRDFI